MEVHATLFERQTAMLQDAPHLAFQVGYNFLVVHIQDLTRQHFMPVFHHGVVLFVVMGQVQHVVGEILTRAEQLFVTAKAAIERMPAGIDDLGVRQNQVQQAHVNEIIGQFIGEVRFVRQSVTFAFFDVLTAVGVPVLIAQVSDRLRVSNTIGAILSY